MRRVLTFLALCCALLAAVSCDYDTDRYVDAAVTLYYANGDIVTVNPVRYKGYHHNILKDTELESIFQDLTRNVSLDFTAAYLTLDVFDAITDEFLRTDTYGVVYNSYTGHYDFTEMGLTSITSAR